MLCAKLFLLSCLVSVALTQPKESGSGVSTANMAAKSILTGSLRKFAINNENFEIKKVHKVTKGDGQTALFRMNVDLVDTINEVEKNCDVKISSLPDGFKVEFEYGPESICIIYYENCNNN
ncbi:uncharacterized protein [Eurosta solidaginis]|uniref:uncharacterized protein isoform X1 n=1 Tax=Eurosta solidaginis TaxID=178769 RepID=UPI003530FF3D